jgi:hypothetical protein
MKALPRILLLLACAASASAQAATIEMKVSGLVCAFCAVALKDGQDIPDAELRRALTNAGYTVKSIERTETPIATVRERLKQSKP